MFEKNLAICDLFDRYSSVLSVRHREVLDFYYNQDLSLAEIAAEVGISRQGVREAIKKAEDELFFRESKLHLSETAESVREAAERLLALEPDEAVRNAAIELCRAAGVL